MAKWKITAFIMDGARGSRSRGWQKAAAIRSFFLGFLLAISPISAFASANVTLSWSPNAEPVVAGYNIYYGGASGVYTNVIDAGTSTSVTISNLSDGATYFFASTTYSAAGAESALSSEVSYTVPVVPVNQPPTLNPVNNLTVNANAGSQTVNLTGIASSSTGGSQVLTVTANSSNTNLISNPVVNYIGTNSSGSLTFSPVGNAGGSATITVMVDNGGASNNVTVRSFVVTVGLVTEQLRRTPGGQMVLTVSGPAGSSYVIQTSTDLVQWTPFSTNTISPGGSVDIVDLNPNSPQKFYRAAPYVVSAPPEPQQSDFKMANGVFSFTLSGLAGTYVIQWSTDLLNWTSFSTNTIPSGGSIQIIDPNTASAMKIYRAVPYIVAGIPPLPQLSGFQLSRGVFSFTLNGPAGSNYVIQASTDLVHWTPFSTNTISPDGSVAVVDLNPAAPQKFYRAASFNNAAFLALPQLSGFKLSSAGFSFVLNGHAGHNYDIQATQDFAAWTVIGTVTMGANGSLNFTDTNSASFSRRFYRIHDTQP
jgi:hypothetical protein